MYSGKRTITLLPPKRIYIAYQTVQRCRSNEMELSRWFSLYVCVCFFFVVLCLLPFCLCYLCDSFSYIADAHEESDKAKRTKPSLAEVLHIVHNCNKHSMRFCNSVQVSFSLKIVLDAIVIVSFFHFEMFVIFVRAMFNHCNCL